MALGIPAVIENFLQTIVGFVDTLFVAKLGLGEVAAVGVSNTIIAVYLAIFLAIGVGCSSLIGKSIGAGDLAKAQSIARQATWLAILAGLLFGILSLFFAEPMLRLMGAEADVIVDGVVYFRIIAVPSILMSLMTVFGSILRSAGDTKTPMKVSIWMNIIHVGLDYVLIFGLFAWEGWGIAGAAYATVISRLLGTVALYFYIRKSSLSFSLKSMQSNEYILPLLRLSGPAAAERLIMRLGQVLYFGLIIGLGTKIYAAHMIAGNIEIFSYMPGYGFAVAATTLVAQQLGSGRKKDAFAYGLISTGIAALLMSVAGVLMFIFAPVAASWFTNQTDVMDKVTAALRISAIAQPFLAVGLVLTGALQGAGDTKSPMYSTAIGMWVIRVAGVYILAVQLDLGIVGIWLSILVDLIIRALFLFWRFTTLFRHHT
ncbi:MATE family efflux transporter [Paenibacillus alkaliterrae]|uniref:MATE family efflux transporter n=1 Tax=Paenibacillus alkaliterrae TaxID=320909 RepID=UPI002E236ABD